MTKLVLLNLKRKKKSWRMMLIVMTLAYTFLAMVLTFCSSLDRTEEAEREADYGSWHVALIHADLESIERMKNHATVERAGISYTYGMVLDLKEEDLGKIGTADEHTIEMEKIHLLEGRFPKGDGELAAERSALTALGYLGEPGQQVSVKIQISQGGEKREVQKDFTLVGIVQDYSSRIKGTTLDKKDYVSFFVDEAEEGFVPSEGNIVFRLKEKSLEFYNEILREKGIRAEGVANNYTYYELMRDSAHRQMEKKQEQFKMIILGLYLFWAIFISTIFTYLKSQKDSIMILRKIGHEKRKTKRLIYIELLGVHTLAFLLGNISGIFLSSSLFFFLDHVTGFSGCFFVELKSFTFLAAIEVISSFILLQISVMILVSDKMLVNRKKRSQMSKRKKFNWKVFVGKKDRVISGCVIFVLFLLVYMSVYTVGDIHYAYQQETAREDTAAYEFGGLYSYYPAMGHAKEADYEKLRNVYGIENIEGIKGLKYVPMEWEGMEQSEYVDMLCGSFWTKFSEGDNPQAFLIGVEQNRQFYKGYEAEIDVGEIDIAEFQQGNEVILYLPKCFCDNNGNFFSDKNEAILEMRDVNAYTEKMISVGDYIRINGKNVRIGGIINSVDQENMEQKLVIPFSVIGSFKFCSQVDVGLENSYEYLMVETKKQINVEQAEQELMQVKITLPFINNRLLRDDLLSDSWNILVLLIYVDFICISLVLIYEKGRWELNVKKYERRWKIYLYLGISKNQFISHFLKEVLWSSAGVVACAFFCMTMYHYCSYYIAWSGEKERSISRMGIRIFSILRNKVSWEGMTVITILMLGFIMVKTIYKIKKVLKNFKM